MDTTVTVTLPVPPADRADQQQLLDAAYRHCAAIAARHGKSYHLATRLLPPDRRPAVHALYAAARTADDLVDVPGSDPAGDLAGWSRALLAELDAGWSADPVRLALVHTYRRYAVPAEHLVDFLAAMTSDLEVTGYADLGALDRYMWGSAAVIGLQVLPVLGTAPGVTREEAAPYAIALGEAFQPVTVRTASKASTAQTGTTRKNSSSSSGIPPIRTGSTCPVA